MLDALAPGDVVTVTRIDRLARSTFDLFAIVKQIVDAKAQFRSLAEPWADTGTSTGRLMIAVLGGLADVERDLIRTRTAEGRSRAQKRGQHMGRTLETHRRAEGRGTSAASGGRDPCRTRAQLRRGEEHDFTIDVCPSWSRSLEMSDDDYDDRFEPMNFYSSAEDYYQSAICIMQSHESGKLRLNYPFVAYYLFSHAVELALKGFLRTKGVSKKDLRNKYLHKFRELITECII